MRLLFFPSLLISLLLLQSCDSQPEAPARSQQFIDDSLFVEKYTAWFDTIYANLPSYTEVEKIKCPAGCFDDVVLFDEKNPFLIFEPTELDRTQNGLSYFRYDKLQGFHEEAEYYIDWNADLREDYDYAVRAEKIRNLIGKKYFCVFYCDTATYLDPKLDKNSDGYIGGFNEGFAVMVDFTTAKPVCAFKVEAENSAKVTYETYENMGELGEIGLLYGARVDLWNNIAIEIQNKLYQSKTSVKNDPSNIIHDPIN